MDVQLIEDRFHQMGISFPLQPFQGECVPLFDLFRWSDFLGLEFRRNEGGAKGLLEFLYILGCTRVPQFEPESHSGIAGLVAAVHLPDPKALYAHALANVELYLELDAVTVEAVFVLLERFARRHVALSPLLLDSVRRTLGGRLLRLPQGVIDLFCKVLQQWGDESDLGLLVNFLRDYRREYRLSVLNTIHAMGLSRDSQFLELLDTLPSPVRENPSAASWRDLLAGLDGGDLEAWSAVLRDTGWSVRLTACRILQHVAIRHPDPETVLNILRKHLETENDRDVLVATSWALGSCLKRLGVEAAEVLLRDLGKRPLRLDTRAGWAVLRALLRLPRDPEIGTRISAALDTFDWEEADTELGVQIVLRHFDPQDTTAERIAERLQPQADWLADLADEFLELDDSLQAFLEQRADVPTRLWIAMGTKAKVAGWIRCWEAARLAVHQPELAFAFADSLAHADHSDQKQAAAIGCTLTNASTGIHPLHLACALDIPPTAQFPDTPESAVVLLELLQDPYFHDAALARLKTSGPVVRELWSRILALQQRRHYHSPSGLDVRNQLFLSGAPAPFKLPVANTSTHGITGVYMDPQALEFRGLVPGPDPVSRARLLGSLSEPTDLRMASPLWASTLEGAIAAWTVLMAREDDEGFESACRMADRAPQAFWEGPDGKARLERVVELRTETDRDVQQAARKLCDRLGVPPLESESEREALLRSWSWG